jgi:hypothetical protein
MARIVRLGLCLALLSPAAAHADGGTLRVSKRCDVYRISLFTSPTAPRAGLIDFSVLVQSADSDVPLLDVPVTVTAYRDGDSRNRIDGPATTAAATNKLFLAISLNLSEAGRWHVEVAVGPSERRALVEADLEVGPPLPSWLDLGIWIGWPAVVVMLFAVHQFLVRRRSEYSPKGQSNQRRTARTDLRRSNAT